MTRLFTVVFLVLFHCSRAQTITGKVSDMETGIPVFGASVILIDTDRGTVTDEDGNFLLEGQGPILVSYIGYKNYRIRAGSEFLNIQLSPEITELQTVEVVGRISKSYDSKYSFSATKTAMENKDIPQAISTVTKELIADRQAFQLADAVKVVSGVTPSSYYNQYNIRGISQNEEGQIINGMRTRQFYFLQPLTTNIERVEVIKGPASATFASVDPGGSINMVTKKPLPVDRKEVSLGVGSFSTFTGTLDFTGPLNESKTLLYRVNGAYREGRSYRDLVNNKTILISPSFSYIPNDKTAINAELIYNDMNGVLDRGQPIFGAQAGVTDLKSTPISMNLGAPNDFFRSKELIVMGNIVHKFNSNISFNASYMKQSWTEDLQEHRTTGAFAVDINNEPVTSLAAMQFVEREQYWNIDNISSYFNFDFNTGSINHKLLVGYDLHYWQKLKGGGQNAARGFLLNDDTVASSFDMDHAGDYKTIEVDGVVMPRPNVGHVNLNNPRHEVRDIRDYTMNSRIAIPSALTTNNAVYIQEQLQFRKITLLLSLRHEWFKDITNYETPNETSFENQRLIPRIGLTYALNDNINIYGTYLEGFQPQSNTTTLLPSTANFLWSDVSAALFDPLTSNLKEVGAKVDLFHRHMSLNVSVYEINQKNILMSANDPSRPDLMVQRGADRSRGFEMDITGYINPDWQIIASYSYIDAKIKKDTNEDLIGQRKENTPKNSANLWTKYDFRNISSLKDLAVGFGIQHQSSKVPWFTRDFRVPAFTVFDAAVYYAPSKSNIRVALNIGNLFNTKYWLGAQNYLRLFPGAPRNGSLVLNYKF
ncbi:TonB-dependent receptor domain-containing protein [Sinomicrobium sp. M5D2P9]